MMDIRSSKTVNHSKCVQGLKICLKLQVPYYQSLYQWLLGATYPSPLFPNVSSTQSFTHCATLHTFSTHPFECSLWTSPCTLPAHSLGTYHELSVETSIHSSTHFPCISLSCNASQMIRITWNNFERKYTKFTGRLNYKMSIACRSCRSCQQTSPIFSSNTQEDFNQTTHWAP